MLLITDTCYVLILHSYTKGQGSCRTNPPLTDLAGNMDKSVSYALCRIVNIMITKKQSFPRLCFFVIWTGSNGTAVIIQRLTSIRWKRSCPEWSPEGSCFQNSERSDAGFHYGQVILFRGRSLHHNESQIPATVELSLIDMNRMG